MQGMGMFYQPCKLTICNPSKHIPSAFFEAGPIGRVVAQGRPREK